MASSTASILALSSSFIITDVGENQQVGGSKREEQTQTGWTGDRQAAGLTLHGWESPPSESRTFRLVERQIVDACGNVHHELLALLHRPQG